MAKVYSFSILWDAINPSAPWASNPWVWVYAFEPHPQTGPTAPPAAEGDHGEGAAPEATPEAKPAPATRYELLLAIWKWSRNGPRAQPYPDDIAGALHRMDGTIETLGLASQEYRMEAERLRAELAEIKRERV